MYKTHAQVKRNNKLFYMHSRSYYYIDNKHTLQG